MLCGSRCIDSVCDSRCKMEDGGGDGDVMDDATCLISMPECRHCTKEVDMSATYASVVFLGRDTPLVSPVVDLEAQIRPGITAMCPKCDRVSIVCEDGGSDSCLHVLWLWRCFGPFLDSVANCPGGKR